MRGSRTGCHGSCTCAIIHAANSHNTTIGEQAMSCELTESQKAAIDKMRKGGVSIKEIAKVLHVGDKRVSAYVRRGESSKAECKGKAGKSGKCAKPCGCKHGIDEAEALADYGHARVMFGMLAVQEIVELLTNTLNDLSQLVLEMDGEEESKCEKCEKDTKKKGKAK